MRNFFSFNVEELWVKFGTCTNTRYILLHTLDNILGSTVSQVAMEGHPQVYMNILERMTPVIFHSKKVRSVYRSSHSDVFLRKSVLKICSKFTGEHPCPSAISIKLQSNLIEIILWHGSSPVNLLHIFRTPSRRNTSEWLLLYLVLLFQLKDPYNTLNKLNLSCSQKRENPPVFHIYTTCAR